MSYKNKKATYLRGGAGQGRVGSNLDQISERKIMFQKAERDVAMSCQLGGEFSEKVGPMDPCL